MGSRISAKMGDLHGLDQNLVPLGFRTGLAFRIGDCPSFGDTILDAMGSTENEAFLYAPQTHSLNIGDRLNFSIAALRRWVAARLVSPNASVSNFNAFVFLGNANPFSDRGPERGSRFVEKGTLIFVLLAVFSGRHH